MGGAPPDTGFGCEQAVLPSTLCGWLGVPGLSALSVYRKGYSRWEVIQNILELHLRSRLGLKSSGLKQGSPHTALLAQLQPWVSRLVHPRRRRLSPGSPRLVHPRTRLTISQGHAEKGSRTQSICVPE